MAGTVDVGTLLVKYNADTGALTAASSQAKNALSSISDTAQSSGGGVLGGFGKMISGAVDFGAKVGQTIFGIRSLAQSAISLGSALLEPNASMEQTTVAFKQLLGSSSAATAELKDLQSFAASTPFEFPELADSTQKLLAFQYPLKETKPLLTAIGDALSGLGENTAAKLDQVVSVFGQMKSSAHLMTGDVMQLTSVGINGFQILADQMHKPVSAIKDMISSGLIPAGQGIEMLRKGMEKTFGGGMAAQAVTFNGLLSTFQDNIGAAWRTMSGPLFDAAKQGLIQIGNLVSSKQFQDFAQSTGKNIADIFSKIGTFVSTNVVPAFQKLGPVIGQIGTFFNELDLGELTADFQNLVAQAARLVAPLQGAQGPLGDLASTILPALGGILTGVVLPSLDTVVFGIGQFLQALNEGNPWAQAFADILVGIGVAFAAIQIGAFLATIPALVAGFIAWAVTAGAAAVATIAATWPLLAIGAAITIVVAGIILAVQHWGQIVGWLKGAWSSVAGFFGGIWQSIQGFFGGIGNWFHDRFTQAKTGAQSGFSGLGQWFSDQGKSLQQTAQTIGTGVVNAFNWMYQHNTYFKAMVDGIKLVVHDWQIFLTMVWAAISADATKAWSAITSWISNQWNRLSELANAVFTVISGFITSKIQYAVTLVHAVWAAVQGWLAGEWAQLQGLAQTAWDGVVAVFNAIWGRVSGPLQGFWANLSGWFGSLASSAFSWGANIIQGVINGIGSMFSALGSAASGAADTVAQYLGFHSPAKQGPGKELDIWGPNLVKGFAQGIDRAAPMLQATMTHLMAVGTYPIRPSAMAVASSAQSVAASGSSGDHTTIIELDSMQLAEIVQKATDRKVRLKLSAKGRSI